MTGGPGSPPGFRLGLIGGFGAGNVGNDATAQVVVEHLREGHPDVAVSLVVDRVPPADRLGPSGAPLVCYLAPVSPRAGSRSSPKIVERPLAVLAAVRRAWVTGRSFDGLIVLGGGVFEAESTAGRGLRGAAAFVALARSARHFTFVAIGASPSTDRVLNAVARLTLAWAEEPSFRDVPTRAALAQVSTGVADGRLTPDVVFARPPAARDVPSGETRLGIGLMGFSWLRRVTGVEVDTENPYIAELATVAAAALGRGWHVDLFVGDEADLPTMRALEQAVSRLVSVPAGRLNTHTELTFDDVLDAVSACDVVVASRFHNIIAAFLAGRPAVALADRPKVRELMRTFGLAGFLLDARSFHAAAVLDLVDEALADRVDHGRRIQRRTADLHSDALAELARLDDRISAWKRSARSRLTPQRRRVMR